MRLFKFVLILWSFWIVTYSGDLFASNLSFSARLVNSDGSPVAGPVDLKFELVYSNDISNILCTTSLPGVALSSGVFHANLEFTALNCTGSQELHEVLEATPPNESLMMRVVDETDLANPKTYPFQALNTVPMSVMSEVSKTLIQMGATNGQVLKWDGTQWAPGSDDGEAGTVTQIDTGAGLTGGPITGSGTVAVATGGISETLLAADSITSAKIIDGTIQNADIGDGQIEYIKLNIGVGEIPNDRIAGLGSAALADIGTSAGMVMGADTVPNCAANQKLQMSLGPTFSWSCVDDSTATDNTKLPLAGGTMSGAIDMGANAVTNLPIPSVATDATTKQYVDDGLADKANTTDLDSYVARTGDNMTGALKLDAQSELRLADSDSNEYVGLRSHANVVGNYVLTLPADTGAADQVLSTDGTGNLSWTTPSTTATPEGAAGGELAGTYPNPTIADNVIDNANVMVGANISAAKVGTGVVDNTEFNTLDGVTSSIQTQLDAKEASVTAGTTAQYRRGDKTWQTLDTSVVPENGNLYFTNVRAQGAVVTQTIADAVTATSPSEDAVFDALALKADQSSLSNYVLKAGDSMSGNLDMGTNTVTNLAAPSVAGDAATKQYVDDGLATKANSTDLNNYVEIAGDDMTGALGLNAQNQLQFRDSDSTNYVALRSPATVLANVVFNLPGADGTAGQVLSTDGAGNLAWASSGDGSVTSVTATAPLSSSGTNTPDISISQANSTTDGYLSSTDWNTFNNKEPAVTTGTTAQYRRGDKTWQTLDTSVVPENGNLYYTTARARTDAVDDAIVDAVTDVAPSQNAVFDALALKADQSSLSNYVLKAGDTMTGALNLPADGLAVGTNQLITSGGNVGIGTATPTSKLHLSGSTSGNDAVARIAAPHSQLMLVDTDDNSFGHLSFSNGRWGFRTNDASSSPHLWIDDNGSIGAGTMSPKGKMEVNTGGTSLTGTVDIDGTTTVLGTSTNFTTALSVGDRVIIDGENKEVSSITSDTQLSVSTALTNTKTGIAIDKSAFIVNDGNVGIGTNTPRKEFEVTNANDSSSLTVETDAKYPNATLFNYLEGGNGHPHFSQGNFGGTKATPSATPSGSILSTSIAYGHDGTNSVQSGRISFRTEDTFAAGYNPTKLEFAPGNGTGSYSTRMTIRSDGSVGVGTGNPEGQFHVLGGVSTFDSGAATVRIKPGTSDHTYFELYADSAAPTVRSGWIGYGSSGTNDLTINNEMGGDVVLGGGNVGIGTSAPLGDGNDLTIGNASGNQGKIYVYGSTANAYSSLHTTNGNLHVDAGYGSGATGDGVYLNWYGGNITHVGNGSSAYGQIKAASFTTASDRRLKQNIETLESSLDKVLKLRGVEYYFSPENYTKKKQVGLIAQEVREVFPEIVNEDQEGFLSVSYSKLVAPLIEATKEQQKEIKANREMFKMMQKGVVENSRKIAALEKEVQGLKEENKELQKSFKAMQDALCEINPDKSFCH